MPKKSVCALSCIGLLSAVCFSIFVADFIAMSAFVVVLLAALALYSVIRSSIVRAFSLWSLLCLAFIGILGITTAWLPSWSDWRRAWGVTIKSSDAASKVAHGAMIVDFRTKNRAVGNGVIPGSWDKWDEMIETLVDKYHPGLELILICDPGCKSKYDAYFRLSREMPMLSIFVADNV